MTRTEMLDEHLNVIHIMEELDLPKLKSKSKALGDAAATGNILKFKRIYDTMPEINIGDLKGVARKKFPAEFKESEKYINTQLKNAPLLVKDSLILSRASLRKLHAESKDPTIREKIQGSLETMDVIIKKLRQANLSDKGITLIIFAVIVSWFIGMSWYLAPILAVAGLASIAAAIILFIAGNVVSVFVEAKKKGEREVK
jgi:hypothetical protein